MDIQNILSDLLKKKPPAAKKSFSIRSKQNKNTGEKKNDVAPIQKRKFKISRRKDVSLAPEKIESLKSKIQNIKKQVKIGKLKKTNKPIAKINKDSGEIKIQMAPPVAPQIAPPTLPPAMPPAIPASIQQKTSKVKQLSSKPRRSRRKIAINDEDFINTNLNEYKFDDDVELKKKLPPKRKKGLRYSRYILNNNKNFLKFIKTRFDLTKYKNLEDDDENIYVKLFPHQKLVKDYLDFLSPYRGLFLYFGLGTGKTCSSIAIAEGLKNYNKIVVMTPASLAQNYKSQLMFCGDLLFKKNQYWEKVSLTDASGKIIPERIYVLKKVLGLPEKFIRMNNGAWLVNYEKLSKEGPNYNTLASRDASIKIAIDKQIDVMIDNKYHFISYNGLTERKMKLYEGIIEDDETSGETKNKKNNDPYGVQKNGGNFFNNKVVIIDEVHNLISRIVNKINANDLGSVSARLYNLLMNAENCRIVFLSGTPIINYPNEIAVFYNILRGTIRTFVVKLKMIKSIPKKVFLNLIRKRFNKTDYLKYNASTETLTITLNPFNFVDKYSKQKKYIGVARKELNESNNPLYTSSLDIRKTLERIIPKNVAKIQQITETKEKCFNDDFEEFTNYFINADTGALKNKPQFQKRIIGLTSYYKNKNTELLPRFNPDTDIITEYAVMSQHQLSKYEKVRLQEHKSAADSIKLRKMSDLYNKSTNSYRTFSRLYCNFTFPDDIERPMPPKREKKTDATKVQSTTENTDGETKKVEQEEISLPNNINLEETSINDSVSNEELEEKKESRNDIYNRLIREAIDKLKARQDTVLVGEGLAQHSPKYLKILNNILNPSETLGLETGQEPDLNALHLVYSSFYSLEGLGIFKLVLEANGFVEFVIEKNPQKNNQYDIMMEDDVLHNSSIPKFVIFSGSTSTEIKEIYRIIYNGEWDERLPTNIKNRLEAIPNHENNLNANVIKCFMITSSGAEGINLKNTRYVHIMEPYWHPVREEQVIGRAVRLNSHINLPEEKRFVKVFKYLTVFSYEQIHGRNEAGEDTTKTIKMVSPQIKKKDVSKTNKNKVITTDEALEEISARKKKINTNILNAIKQSAIDCKIHNKPGTNEYKQCFEINTEDYSDRYIYAPIFADDDTSMDSNLNKAKNKKSKNPIINYKYNGVNIKVVIAKQTPTSDNNVLVGKLYLYDDIIRATSSGSTNFNLIQPIEENYIYNINDPKTQLNKPETKDD